MGFINLILLGFFNIDFTEISHTTYKTKYRHTDYNSLQFLTLIYNTNTNATLNHLQKNSYTTKR